MPAMSNPPATSTRHSQRAFAGLWVARDVALLGDGILLVALLGWSYRLLESATVVSILLVAMLLPPFLLTPLAGRMVHRGRAQVAVVLAQLLRAAALIPLLGIGTSGSLPLVLVVAFVAAIPSAFVRASQDSLLRALVKGDHLTEAQKAFSNTRLLVLAAGPALGTALYGVSGLYGTTLAVLATLALSTLALLLAGPPAGERSAEAPAIGPAELQQGLLCALRHPRLQAVAVVQLGTALFTGGLTVALVAFTVWGIYVTPDNVGLILAAQGLGAVVASALWNRIDRRLAPGISIATALGIAAASTFAFALTSSMGGAIPFGVAMGFGLGLLAAGLDSLLATHSTPQQRPAMLAGLDMATASAVLLSAIALGPISDLMPPRLTIALAAVLLSVLGLYAFGAISDPDRGSLPDPV